MSVSHTASEIFASKNVVTLKPVVGVVQDHTVFRTVYFRVGVTKCSLSGTDSKKQRLYAL